MCIRYVRGLSKCIATVAIKRKLHYLPVRNLISFEIIPFIIQCRFHWKEKDVSIGIPFSRIACNCLVAFLGFLRRHGIIFLSSGIWFMEWRKSCKWGYEEYGDFRTCELLSPTKNCCISHNRLFKHCDVVRRLHSIHFPSEHYYNQRMWTKTL